MVRKSRANRDLDWRKLTIFGASRRHAYVEQIYLPPEYVYYGSLDEPGLNTYSVRRHSCRQRRTRSTGGDFAIFQVDRYFGNTSGDARKSRFYYKLSLKMATFWQQYRYIATCIDGTESIDLSSRNSVPKIEKGKVDA